jgi:hypothetical protein
MESGSWRSKAPPPQSSSRAPPSHPQTSSRGNPSSTNPHSSQKFKKLSPSSAPFLPHPSSPIIGKTYFGKVWNVRSKGNRLGIYCKFGENKNQRYELDGFIPKIILNKFGEEYQHGDEIEVICLTLQPITLALSPTYIRPLLIVDVNGPLGNRAPYEPNSSRKFLRRKYSKEFLECCSRYYEIAIWSCAKRNNIELELFSEINLYFIWSQDESTSLYPRTSFVSPKKVWRTDFF